MRSRRFEPQRPGFYISIATTRGRWHGQFNNRIIIIIIIITPVGLQEPVPLLFAQTSTPHYTLLPSFKDYLKSLLLLKSIEYTQMKYSLARAALSLFTLISASSAALTSRATTCNGHSEVRKMKIFLSIHLSHSLNLVSIQFCDKSYGNISFVGAHDSYAVGTNNCELDDTSLFLGDLS